MENKHGSRLVEIMLVIIFCGEDQYLANMKLTMVDDKDCRIFQHYHSDN